MQDPNESKRKRNFICNIYDLLINSNAVKLVSNGVMLRSTRIIFETTMFVLMTHKKCTSKLLDSD